MVKLETPAERNDMDEKDMQQQTEPQEDGFLDGWEETGPELEAEKPAVDGEVQAEAKPEEQEKGGPDGGAEQTAGPTGGSGGPEGEAAQPGNGGPGGEGLPPAGESGQPGGQPDGQQPPPAPKTWTLSHMGQAVTISEADVPGLAQKALDYDCVRASYDEARPVMDLFRGFAQQAGMSVQEYVGRLRVQAKQMEGMDEAAARQAVEMEDREVRVAAQEAEARARQEAARRAQAAQARQQERINADIQEFIGVYPDAARDFKSIPQEVWDAVNGGMSLVAAYTQYKNAQSSAAAQAEATERQRQEAAQRQNAQNAANSTGSMKSAGNNNGPKDPFLEGWDE